MEKQQEIDEQKSIVLYSDRTQYANMASILPAMNRGNIEQTLFSSTHSPDSGWTVNKIAVTPG